MFEHPNDTPTAQTSCVILLYDGAPALGGADLTLELLVEFVVVLELDPVWYVVVAVEVYPPSIAVLDPDVFVCVEPGYAGFINANKHINTISIPVK